MLLLFIEVLININLDLMYEIQQTKNIKIIKITKFTDKPQRLTNQHKIGFSLPKNNYSDCI